MTDMSVGSREKLHVKQNKNYQGKMTKKNFS